MESFLKNLQAASDYLCCRVVCQCGSCDESKMQSLGEWERHTGCRAKKWKHSVKVKATMLPLEQWVCTISCILKS